jgi:hypothetical protein
MPSPPDTSATEPEMHDTQRNRLAELRQDPGVRSVQVLEVALVTGSVQVTVRISPGRGRTHAALIAPSGRLHRL